MGSSVWAESVKPDFGYIIDGKKVSARDGATRAIVEDKLSGVEVGSFRDRVSGLWWGGFATYTVAPPQNLSGDFSVVADDCLGTHKGSGECNFNIRFAPKTLGYQTVSIRRDISATYVDGGTFSNFHIWNISATGVQRPPEKSVCERGSIINVGERSLIESVPIVGTGFDMVYSSAYASEFKSKTSVLIPDESFNREGWTISVRHFYDSSQKRLFLGNGNVVYTDFFIRDGDHLVLSPQGDEVYVFDSVGRHWQTLTALTGAVKYGFSYDSNYRLVEVTDGHGLSTLIARDESGRINNIKGPFNQETTFLSNASGLFKKIINPLGAAYEMTYDNNETSGLLSTFKQPGGQITTFTYNANGELVSDVGAGGNSWTFADLVSGLGSSRKTALNRTSTYETTYSSAGNLVRTEATPYGLVTTYSENSGISTTSANIIETTTQQYADDARFGSAHKRTSVFRYKANNVESTTSLNQSVVPASLSSPFDFQTFTETTTTSGRVTSSVFNKNTMTQTVTSPAGAIVKTKLNSHEQPIEIQLGNDTVQTLSYNGSGQLSAMAQGSQTQLSFAYNPQGYLSSVTNARSEVTSYQYDLAGRITKTILPDAREIQYSYDANGNVVSVTPPSRPQHSFLLNAMELLASYLPPSLSGITNKDTTYIYNADKQLTQITRPNGWLMFNYFGVDNGLLSSIKSVDGSFNFIYSSTLKGLVSRILSPYGLANNLEYRGSSLSSIDNMQPSTSFSYGKVSYGYDTDHRVISSTIQGNLASSAITTHRVLNGDGMPTQVGSLALAYSYPSGRLSTTSLGTIADSRTYDSYGNLSSYQVTRTPIGGSASMIYAYTLTRDNMSRIMGKTETVGGMTTTYVYSYDSAGRLTTVNKNGVTITSSVYDGNSNRLSGTDEGIAYTATYDNQDRLATWNGRSYSYNANGDLLAIQWGPNSQSQYAYNVLGHLLSVTLQSGAVIKYKPDGFFRRGLREKNAVVSSVYLYEPNGSLAGIVNSSGVLQQQFFYGTQAHSPDYMIAGGVTYRFVKDHLGSIRLVVNTATGAVTQQIDYGVYGKVLNDSNPGFQPFGFAGGLYDHETGLVRFGARDYDPEVGRWTSKDPILFKGGDTNLYGYVGTVGKVPNVEPNLYGYSFNDPINFIDPEGLTGRPAQARHADGSTQLYSQQCQNIYACRKFVNDVQYAKYGSYIIRNNPIG
ncbi:MAG: RHS repeat-associated core domain-containing protein, partial [Bdellovibrio sp.]